jgi:hypothetical protein
MPRMARRARGKWLNWKRELSSEPAISQQLR